ncbi:phenylalanine--tRNA ligase subunit beta [Heliorestis acidaminivorans]|uniref:Phenylalanine--tRNA ligase beta subunit n=1 Tax=Heliorestis acidaminivorans TaxID=553427 RepID=A0A6I0EUV5_9FIRM|nr:phenylalanine--tRNA ligase subunit beta [Heliorestis acidaminivorans]KAB2951572.1 phenylalanine--tRNA ligase subunit beta [Heliorestis acidaminivorans]
MHVSIEWLRAYVDAGLNAEQLADKLTRAGIAVENVIYRDQGLDKVVVGYLQEVEKHPDAERLFVCKVDTGTEMYQIVTGADNVRAGQKVPVATPGAKLPNGLKIKKTKLRGIESIGMLCSAEELALDEKTISPEEREGILILSDDALIGQPIAQTLGLDAPILELELTPNRADCLAVINVAREVSAITAKPLTLPAITVEEKGQGSIEGQVQVAIEDPELCGRYAARLFTNLRLGPSPAWMQQRLQSAGMRPINNIVDITNYVMLEMGHPLHAFDYNRIAKGQIIVRRAHQGEKLITLDEQERQLNPENLVIADPEKAVALAGVMGGLETEVTDKTESILLEAAHFNPASIRRTARQVGLRSEASQRFEKGVNIATVALAMDRAAQLIEELNVADVVPGTVDVYLKPAEERVISFKVESINNLLGTQIAGTEMARFFNNLGFAVKWQTGQEELEGQVTIPTYRQDMKDEHDLAEEVARLFGYDNIATTLPKGVTTTGQRTWPQTVKEKMVQTLVGSGFREVITFSFINPRHLQKLKMTAQPEEPAVIALQNPLSEEQGILRPTMMAGLLDVAVRNASRRINDLAIFELGSTFQPRQLPLQELPIEKAKLSALMMGQEGIHWSGKPQSYDFYYLKGIIEKLLGTLKIEKVQWEAWPECPFLHPGRSARLYTEDGKERIDIGYLGEVHPDVIEAYDLSGRPVVMELDVEALTALAQAKGYYKALPKYPSTDRDMALILPINVPASKVEAIIAQKGSKLVERWQLFDVYQGNQIPEGYRSLAYSLRYQRADRTLTDEEVNKTHDDIKSALTAELGAQFR